MEERNSASVKIYIQLCICIPLFSVEGQVGSLRQSTKEGPIIAEYIDFYIIHEFLFSCFKKCNQCPNILNLLFMICTVVIYIKKTLLSES